MSEVPLYGAEVSETKGHVLGIQTRVKSLRSSYKSVYPQAPEWSPSAKHVLIYTQE